MKSQARVQGKRIGSAIVCAAGLLTARFDADMICVRRGFEQGRVIDDGLDRFWVACVCDYPGFALRNCELIRPDPWARVGPSSFGRAGARHVRGEFSRLLAHREILQPKQAAKGVR